MDDGKKLTRLLVLIILGLGSGASCEHNGGSSPMSPSSPGGRTPDSGTTTHPNGVDDTKIGEPIGPVAAEHLGRNGVTETSSAGSALADLHGGSRIAARASDGLGGQGADGSGGGAPGLGGAPGGGVGAMGGLPQPSPPPPIGR